MGRWWWASSTWVCRFRPVVWACGEGQIFEGARVVPGARCLDIRGVGGARRLVAARPREPARGRARHLGGGAAQEGQGGGGGVGLPERVYLEGAPQGAT